jgi:tetrahydromethanopterin S-methyltransferase subunit D
MLSAVSTATKGVGISPLAFVSCVVGAAGCGAGVWIRPAKAGQLKASTNAPVISIFRIVLSLLSVWSVLLA